MNRDRSLLLRLPAVYLLLSLCVCLRKPVEAYDILVALENGCCWESVNEEAGTFTVCAEILFINGTALTTSNYTVIISEDLTSGTAESGVDYALTPEKLTFPVDSEQGDLVCIDMEIIDDLAVENKESFYVELSTNDSNVQLLDYCQRKSIYIIDSDVITVVGISTSVSENNGSAQACVNITRGTLESTALVYISTSASTGMDSATALEEFQIVERAPLYFQSGDTIGAVRCVSIGIIDDTRVENNEFFNFELANGYGTEVNEITTRIYILEDDVAEIGMMTPNIMEVEAEGSISLCVVLINLVELDIPLTAFVQTQAGTASEKLDYVRRMDAPIDFFPGDFSGVSRCTNITIFEDSIVEYNEAFSVILRENSSRLQIQNGRDSTQITIIEDDDSVNIGFQNLVFSTEEGASATTRVCAQIDTGSLEREVVAILSTTAGGTATENNDYVSVDSQGLTFLPGQSSNSNMSTQCGELVVLNDQALEANETISIRLSSDSPEVIITKERDEAEVIIQEDAADFVAIGFPTGATLNATEGMTTTVNVCPQLLEGTLEREVSVYASTSDFSARATTDYTAVVNREITFRAGESMQCIQVAIGDDRNVLEAMMESFRVTLTARESFVSIPSQQESISINIFEDPLDEITVGLQQTSYTTLETGGPLRICAEMFLGSLERDVSLTLTSTDGNATAPGDYVALNARLVFTAGQSVGDVACAMLDIVDDTAVERDGETLSLSLSPDEPSVTVVTAVFATVEINENDNDVAGSVVLSSSNYDAFENEEAVNVCAVIMAEELERGVIVQLSSQDSTARNIEDYAAFQLVTLTFDEGSVSGEEQCHRVAITDDDIFEGSEVFFVTLTSPEPAFIGSTLARATVTINPDPADFVEFGLLRSNYTISEQPSFRDIAICVMINNGTLERAVEINFDVVDITAESTRDYIGPFPLTLTFTVGQIVGTQQCTTVFALEDTLIENDETFTIALAASPSDGNSVRFTPEASVATITIVRDSTDRAVIQVANSTGTFGEGELVNVCAELVSNGGGLGRPVSVTAVLISGTATYGVDFNGLSPATLTFLPNSNPGSIQCVAVSLMFDNAVEATENFIVELRNNDSAVIVPAGGDLVIVNIRDMPNPFVIQVSFVLRMYSDTEGVGLRFVEVCVQVVLGTIDKNGAAVNLWTVSQTATAGRDFSFLNTSLVFLDGDTVGSPARCIDISILNDNIVEANETFDVVLSSNGILQIMGATSIPVTIYEDPTDFATIGLQPLTSSVQESDTFLVCAELTSGSLERDVFIGLEAENSTAIQGVDFIGPDPPILTFTSGQSTGDIQCADVTILDNSFLEGERNFSVRLVEVATERNVKINDTMQSVDVDIRVDTDDRVTMGFSQSTFTASEDDGFVRICAELLAGQLERDISLLVEVLDLGSNTAILSSDYSGLPQVLSFSSGQSLSTPSCADVTIIDDDTLENTEVFSIALSTDFPEGVSFSRDRSMVQIIDNEEGFTISFSQLIFSTREGDGSVQVCADLISGEIPATLGMISLSVRADLGNSSATSGQDYTGLPSEFSFASGQSLSCIVINIVDDGIIEGKETLALFLQPIQSSPGVRISRGQSIVEIADNDEDNATGSGTSPGVSAALSIVVIIVVALAVALVFTVVAIYLRRRKKKSKTSAGQMMFNQEYQDETELIDPFNAGGDLEKSDIPLTTIENQEKTKSTVSGEKSDIPSKVIVKEEKKKSSDVGKKTDTPTAKLKLENKEEIKPVDSSDVVEKSDIPPTKIENKDEMKPVKSSDAGKKGDVIPLTLIGSEEIKLVDSSDGGKKSDVIPLTLIGSEEEIKLVDSSDAGGKNDVIPLTLIDS